MPATRASARVNAKAQESASRTRLPIAEDEDDVIVISSSDEGLDNAKLSLRKAQREVRTLRKKLSAKGASQVLSDQRNHTADEGVPSARYKKSEEERLRLETQLHQALADIKKLQSALRREKELRTNDIASLRRLKQRVMMVEDENASLKFVNEELRATITGGNTTNNSALQDLENHILCEVCTETLWHPYTLSRCGHTFCQGCLTDWFDVAFQTAVAANAPHAVYTCPTCRAPVYSKPTEDYALKGVVRAIAQAIDLAGEAPSPAPRNQHGRGPWAKFFI